jgi:sulfite exporter TauE/SafE
VILTAFEVRLASAFALALLGGMHCAGMCGGFVMAMHSAAPARTSGIRFALAYHTGRILSYTLGGGLIGLLGAGLYASQVLPVQIGLLVLAAAVLLAIACSLLNRPAALRRLEPIGGMIWSLIRPLAQRGFPPTTAGGALLTGLAWGWIPCGMVYAALPLALVSGSVGRGAAVMFAFGLGTVPNLAALELTARRVQRAAGAGRARAWIRPAVGVALVLFAVSDLAHAARMAGWQSPTVAWVASLCHG